MDNNHIIIYGGSGSLGSKCVSHFKNNNYWVLVIDYVENVEADFNVIVKKEGTPKEQESKIMQILSSVLQEFELEAVICVAGGWMCGNVKNKLLETSNVMWHRNVISSLIATNIAVKYLKRDGLLVLIGAKSALEGTGQMIGYGMAKAAVHQLIKSLGKPECGLPENVSVIGILPVILDTPNNRKAMPNSDFSTWTSLNFVVELIFGWTEKKNCPKSGSLVTIQTNNFNSDIIII